MTRRKGEFRIGTSGYQYDHWRGVFYPEDIPKTRWYEHYASRFDTVEINNTFYNLPKPETFDDWRKRAPEGFLYVLKFSRYGSHLKRLKDPEGPIEKFTECAKRLQGFLGPILVQLPPKWNVNVERLAGFLEAAPNQYRWVLEFRDPSWLCEEVYGLLRDHNAALCIHDMIENHPREITADWVYLRFHGEDYATKYSPQALSGSAGRIKEYLAAGLDVFVFFNNDAHGYAVENAFDLRRYVVES